MSEKIELKEKLAAIDMNVKSLWNEIDDEQRKSLKSEFFILNRYVSNVKSSNRDIQEHFVLAVNEYYNKHWNTLQKHPQILWQLLCMCSHETKKIFYHEWIGYKKKKANNKVAKFLYELYPNMKDDEISLLSILNTESDCKALARDQGFDEKQIDKLFK